MKAETKKKIRIMGMALFICYLAALTYFLFFAEIWGRGPAQREYAYNLVLFREIKRFWNNWRVLGVAAVVMNLAGNIIGFVPFGLILPIIKPKTGTIIRIGLLSFTFSLAVETTQLIFKVGSFDVDDLLLNTIGGVIGYILFWICNKMRRKIYG